MSLAWWLNTMWMQRCARAARQFARAIEHVEELQFRLLRQTLTTNANTDFGRAHGFQDCRSIAEYQQRVPIRAYEDFAPWIDRIAAGETGVLTAEAVRLFEPTSGSTTAQKLIPYTNTLKRQFQAAIGAWIYDLFSHRPAVRQGRAYWSLSPAFGASRRTCGGVRVGFDSDEAYLGTVEQFFAKRLLVMPAAVSKMQAGDAFRYCTLLHLLAASDLSLISVWSPTFLTTLVDKLPVWWEPLCDDLRHGTLRGCLQAATLDADLRKALAPRAAVRRAGELAEIFRHSSMPEALGHAWKRLRLISCWADASAALYSPVLQQQFPAVELQPKGLIATEAFVSFPSHELDGIELAVTSHFFEFLDASGAVRLAHELEVGKIYRVVVTTGGGFYRYDLGDLVEVSGYASGCPLLRFLGRAGNICDLVGEKLNEAFVHAVLQRLIQRFNLSPTFSLLAPTLHAPRRYTLFLQSAGTIGADRLAACLESLLCENPHYQLAIQLQQLVPVQVAYLSANAPSAWLSYEDRCSAAGQRSGAVKPRVLDSTREWDVLLAPFVQSISQSEGIRIN